MIARLIVVDLRDRTGHVHNFLTRPQIHIPLLSLRIPANMDHMDVMGSPEVEESVPTRHPTYYASYTTRAAIPFTPPLTVHLLHLMATKKTNLCISADVQNTSQLLDLAEECGDHICMLKTHADIITDFSEKTITGLSSIAQRKKFLLFEDRKFGDIGSACNLEVFMLQSS